MSVVQRRTRMPGAVELARETPGSRRDKMRRWLLIGAGTVVAVAGLAGAGRLLGLGRLAQVLAGGANHALMTHTVARGNLDITVLASGVLESASTVKVLSKVEGQVSIISMLDRGARVRKDDVVVELDASSLNTRLLEQRVAVQQAAADTGQAIEALEVAKSQAESDVHAAELSLRFARLDREKYLQGDYPQQQGIVQSEITLAEEELKRAKERINYSQELKELGYLSEGQVDADRLSVMRSEVKLRLAEEKKQLLQKFTHVRSTQEFESKVEESERGLERSRSLAQATVTQAETRLKTVESTEQLEKAKLQHLVDQIAHCQLLAPQDGVVLYPMPEEGDDGRVIKPGASVRQRQHVFTIPNTDKLQVSAGVHEAVVHMVKKGQEAVVHVDSFPDLQITGKTTSVSSLPDLQSWRKSTVNFYPAKVLIDHVAEGLRPGMNSKVEIHIRTVKNVLTIPVQSVIREKSKSYCLTVDSSGDTHLQAIQLGKSNDKFVAVKKGLTVGVQVVLSPDEVPFELPADGEG